MEKIDILFTEETIQKRIEELANEIYKVYGDEEVVFVCTLKGAVFFTCDLLKKYKGNATLEFLRVSSYEGDKSSGKVNMILPIKKEKVEGKNVLIVEDIIDTGYTLDYLSKYLKDMGVKTLNVCALLDKKEKRIVPVEASFIGFSIKDLFVIGYGLDYNEKYRQLPYIGVFKN